MAVEWIVVAQRSGARIYKRVDARRPWFHHAIDNPAGRLRDREINTDRPGRDQVGEAHMHEAQVFATYLAEELDKSRARGEFDRLVIFAEPRFQGMIKGALKAPTRKTLEYTSRKDLGKVPDRELAEKLQNELRGARVGVI